MPKKPAVDDRKTYGLRLRQALINKIKHVAVDEGRPINAVVPEALRELLKRRRGR